MNIKIKIAEKRLQRASKKLAKYDYKFYHAQRTLRDLYKASNKQDIYDEQAQMEADRVAEEAWKDGVAIKEENETKE